MAQSMRPGRTVMSRPGSVSIIIQKDAAMTTLPEVGRTDTPLPEPSTHGRAYVAYSVLVAEFAPDGRLRVAFVSDLSGVPQVLRQRQGRLARARHRP